MARDFDDDDDDDEEDVEQVLFQGPMMGLETNLKQNPRLVKAALVPAKKMISDALSRRAGTIILEPVQGRVAIRFVVDGIPYPAGALPGQRGMAMIQMIKVLAGLNPQERNEGQSGGIYAEFAETKYNLLTQTIPLQPGVERLRIRVVNPRISFVSPKPAGMPDDLSEQLRSFTQESKGIVLACGAPESGVTSLSLCALHSVDPYLYSVYNMGARGVHTMMNVTDYEYEEGHDLEMSFDRVLRREADILFMDPLRDPAVAQTMFEFADRACFIGEIDAPTPADAIMKLVEWVGMDLVANHVRAIISQKLIRKLCDDCKQAFRPNPDLLKRLGLPPGTTVLYRAPSPPDEDDEDAPTIEELCEDCDGVPFHGRAPVYELLEMTDGMREVVAANLSLETIRQQMVTDNMRTMQKDALRLVAGGTTALEEVQRSFAPPGGRKPKDRPRPRPRD